MNIEAGFEMDFKYRLTQMQYNMAEILAKASGATGYEISWHSGHRPSHWFGGQQFTFGQMKTLGIDKLMQDYNCYHSKLPVVVGVTPPAYSTAELAAFEKAETDAHEWDGKQYTLYELTQKRNEYARDIAKKSANLSHWKQREKPRKKDYWKRLLLYKQI